MAWTGLKSKQKKTAFSLKCENVFIPTNKGKGKNISKSEEKPTEVILILFLKK